MIHIDIETRVKWWFAPFDGVEIAIAQWRIKGGRWHYVILDDQ